MGQAPDAQTSNYTSASEVPAALQPFVKIAAPAIVLDHVRVIDGTGAAARDNQEVVIERGKIPLPACSMSRRRPRPTPGSWT